VGTITCPGGHTFADAQGPSRILYWVIPDVDLDAIAKDMATKHQGSEDPGTDAAFEVTSRGFPTYKCPVCGRILVFHKGLDGPADSFVPEQGQ